MSINVDEIFKAIQKGVITPLEAIQKGSAVAADAILKSTTVSINVIHSISDIQGRTQAVINGVIGDTLAAQGSQLAIKMELLGDVVDNKLCIFVHGLCAGEESWQFLDDPDTTYGSLLQKDFRWSPLYLRYNSGLHVSTNGQLLAKLIDEVCKNAADEIREIVFIGHSMGGLVVRSACHYGQKNKADWVKRVKKIFLLGTPHHGTDLEKLGNLTSTILKKVPNIVTKGIAALGNKRSAGIKDLRFGYLLDEDWVDHDQDALWQDNRHPVPLLKGVDYYIIAAALAKESNSIFAQYFGDGMVNPKSAAGKSLKKSKHIHFSPKHFKIIKGLSHVKLSHHSKVYGQIQKWCRN